MGCSTSSQTSAVDTTRPSAKPEESNGASTTGAANENGKVVEDSETIPDQTPAEVSASTSEVAAAAGPPAESEPAAAAPADSPPAEAAAPGEAPATAAPEEAAAPADSTTDTAAGSAAATPEQEATATEGEPKTEEAPAPSE